MIFSLIAGLLAASAPVEAIPYPKLAPILRIFRTKGILTIGDSTVTSDAGWSAGFCSDTRGLANCTNLAASGTSATSWRTKPQYDIMLTSCKTPETWATIQFGHTDQKVVNTSVFAQDLEALTLKIKDAGCKPILVTSLARPVFAREYVPTNILGPYANETINVAARLKLLLLPPLNDSPTYPSKLGKAKSVYFNWGWDTNGTNRTHLNALGWKYFGRIVADEVHKYVPELRDYIVLDNALSAAVANGTILPGDIPVSA